MSGQDDKNDDGGDVSSSSSSSIPVRTVNVGPIKADMENRIKSYFEQFGTVNSVSLKQEDNAPTYYAFVEFKTARTAAEVLSSTELHHIDGCDVQVKAAKPWNQPGHILNALDDFCLRSILSYLNQSDLLNAANVCVRFNQQAKSVFSVKFKKLDLTTCNYEKTKQSLVTFGSSAQTIDVESKYSHCPESGYEIEILSMIAKNCTPALKDLTITAFNFENEPSSDVQFDSALNGLEVLSLNDCHLQNNMTKLLSACVELKVLMLDCCTVDTRMSVPKFDKLEELQLSEIQGFDSHFLDDIIALNSTIKKLSLNAIASHCFDELMDHIVKNLPDLLEFSFSGLVRVFHKDDFADGIRCLGQLRSLKVLKFDLNQKSAAFLSSILIGNASPIEHIQLNNGTIDTETIENLSQMKELKFLELFDMDGLIDGHMIKLAEKVGSHLEKVQLEGTTAANLTTIGLKKMLPFATKLSLLTLKSTTITIDADDYKAILRTIQQRQEQAKLQIKLTGGGGQVKVDEIIQEENRNILYIDEINSVVKVDYDDSLSGVNSYASDDSDDSYVA